MRRPRLRAFSPWPSVASPTGLETALLTVLSLPARPDRWRPVPAIGRGHDPRQPALGLAVRSHRRRHRVSAGMVLRDQRPNGVSTSRPPLVSQQLVIHAGKEAVALSHLSTE